MLAFYLRNKETKENDMKVIGARNCLLVFAFSIFKWIEKLTRALALTLTAIAHSGYVKKHILSSFYL